MKKRIMTLVLALALTAVGLAGQSNTALAKEQPPIEWKVTYEKDGKTISSNFKDVVTKDRISNVMPGDTVIFEVTCKNESGSEAMFYLNTDIINTLEEKDAEGNSSSEAKNGAYTMEIYKPGHRNNPIYNSDLIGGTSSTQGLKQIDTGDNTYFELGSISNGSTSKVDIAITLDGNSQDNDYMYKLATLDVKFGAEKVKKPTPKVVDKEITHSVVYTVPGEKKVVYTNPDGSSVVQIDDPDTPLATSATGGAPATGDSMVPIIVCTAGLIIGLLFIGLYFILARKQREEVA